MALEHIIVLDKELFVYLNGLGTESFDPFGKSLPSKSIGLHYLQLFSIYYNEKLAGKI